MKINSRWIKASATAVALGAVVTGTALAQSPQTTTDDASATSPAEEIEEQDPQLNGSITVADDESVSEADESAQLAQLDGLISDADAIARATSDGGTATEAALENENGTVVYEVVVTRDDGTVEEVKVDAGNGDVLAREADDGDEADGDEAEGDEAEGDEADGIEHENEGEEGDHADEPTNG